MATVYDVLKRASAQQYSGEAQTDELEDESLLELYLWYANEGFRRIWRQIDPIEPIDPATRDPQIVRIECPQLLRDSGLDEYDPRVFDALADYVTWRMLGTGNLTKQQRGEWYYARFVETLGRIPKHANWAIYNQITGGGFVGVWDW